MIIDEVDHYLGVNSLQLVNGHLLDRRVILGKFAAVVGLTASHDAEFTLDTSRVSGFKTARMPTFRICDRGLTGFISKSWLLSRMRKE